MSYPYCDTPEELLDHMCPTQKWKNNFCHLRKQWSYHSKCGRAMCTNPDDGKVTGRFGLAWVTEMPGNCRSEPTGWQLEFVDTPSNVELHCKKMVEWVSTPPVPNFDCKTLDCCHAESGKILNCQSCYSNACGSSKQPYNCCYPYCHPCDVSDTCNPVYDPCNPCRTVCDPYKSSCHIPCCCSYKSSCHIPCCCYEQNRCIRCSCKCNRICENTDNDKVAASENICDLKEPLTHCCCHHQNIINESNSKSSHLNKESNENNEASKEFSTIHRNSTDHEGDPHRKSKLSEKNTDPTEQFLFSDSDPRKKSAEKTDTAFEGFSSQRQKSNGDDLNRKSCHYEQFSSSPRKSSCLPYENVSTPVQLCSFHRKNSHSPNENVLNTTADKFLSSRRTSPTESNQNTTPSSHRKTSRYENNQNTIDEQFPSSLNKTSQFDHDANRTPEQFPSSRENIIEDQDLTRTSLNSPSKLNLKEPIEQAAYAPFSSSPINRRKSKTNIHSMLDESRIINQNDLSEQVYYEGNMTSSSNPFSNKLNNFVNIPQVNQDEDISCDCINRRLQKKGVLLVKRNHCEKLIKNAATTMYVERNKTKIPLKHNSLLHDKGMIWQKCNKCSKEYHSYKTQQNSNENKTKQNECKCHTLPKLKRKYMPYEVFKSVVQKCNNLIPFKKQTQVIYVHNIDMCKNGPKRWNDSTPVMLKEQCK